MYSQKLIPLALLIPLSHAAAFAENPVDCANPFAHAQFVSFPMETPLDLRPTQFDHEDDVAVVGDPLSMTAGPGTGAVNVIVRDAAGMWNLVATLNDGNTIPVDNPGFGFAVAISNGTIVVGAPFDEGVGAAFVFERVADEAWQMTQRLALQNGIPGSRFGDEVAIDGNRIAVAATETNQVYIFENADGSWSSVAQLGAPGNLVFEDFGKALALDGTRLAVAATNPATSCSIGSYSGDVVMYERNGVGEWVFNTRINPGAGQVDLTLDLDGDRLAIGVERQYEWMPGNPCCCTISTAGTALELYERGATTWTVTGNFGCLDWSDGQTLCTFLPTLDPCCTTFGLGVSLDGDRIAYGGWDDAYSLREDDGDWSLTSFPVEDVRAVSIAGPETLLYESLRSPTRSGRLSIIPTCDRRGDGFVDRDYLFVSDRGASAVRLIDPATGVVRDFELLGGIPYPNGVTVDANRNVYLSDVTNGRVLRFDPVTDNIDRVFATAGLQGAVESVITPDGKLWVASFGNGSVQEYNIITGLYINDVVPPGSGGLDGAAGMFLSDDELFVCSQRTDEVLAFDLNNMSTSRVAAAGCSLDTPGDVIELDDGTVLVSSFASDEILKFSPAGTCEVFVAAGTAGLDGPEGLALSGAGTIYVANRFGGGILEFDLATGAFVRSIAGAVSEPTYLTCGRLIADDCDQNGVPDQWDIADGNAEDCNENGVPDSCDLASGELLDNNGNQIPDPCESGLIGDLNCDGAISVSDIGAFVLAITDPAAYAASFPECNLLHADANDDGAVSVSDIGPFIALITGG